MKIDDKKILLLIDMLLLVFIIKAAAIGLGFFEQPSQEDITLFAMMGFGIGAIAWVHVIFLEKEVSKDKNQ